MDPQVGTKYYKKINLKSKAYKKRHQQKQHVIVTVSHDYTRQHIMMHCIILIVNTKNSIMLKLSILLQFTYPLFPLQKSK
jgi:hypothetical protein